MKTALKIALGAILLSAGIAGAQSVWRGDINLIDGPTGSSQYQVGGVDIVKSMTVSVVDSLSGAAIVQTVFTTPRAILVQRIDIYTSDAYLNDDDSAAVILLRSTGTSASANLDSGATYQVTDFTDVAFAASLPCTLFADGNGANQSGGALGTITIWYTDN